jgi:hypothetical protein
MKCISALTIPNKWDALLFVDLKFEKCFKQNFVKIFSEWSAAAKPSFATPFSAVNPRLLLQLQ